MSDTSGPACAHCGQPGARTRLNGTLLCDRCLNDQVSEHTGRPRLPDPPPVETVRAADGREVRFRYRLTWALPGMMSAEAEEVDQPVGDGFRFSIYADQEDEPDAVLARLRSIAEREVGQAYLEPREAGPGGGGTPWLFAGDEVAGRIDWSGDGSVREPSVVIDGRRLDWDEFGRMVASFEGWEFRMVFRAASDLSDATTTVWEGEEPAGIQDGEVIPLFGDRGSEDNDVTTAPSIDDALDTGREVPRVDELGHQLFLQTEHTRLPGHPNDLADEDWIEDHLPITRVEAGRLWFGDIGPVEVPTAATDAAEVGWHVTVVLARLDGTWRLVQVGAVYP